MEKVKTKYLSTTKYVLVRTNPLVSLAKLNRIEIFLLRHLIDRYRWKKSEMAKCLNCNIRCPHDGQCRQITILPILPRGAVCLEHLRTANYCGKEFNVHISVYSLYASNRSI